MAIFIQGMRCPLCGRPILAGESVKMFKSFVSDPDDPLFVFSDAALHFGCFYNDARASIAEKRYEAFSEANKAEARRCRISGVLIADPDDYLSLGYITDDPREPLYDYNWAHFSKRALRIWPQIGSLIEMLEEAKSKPIFHKKSLDWLIAELNSTRPPK